MSPGQRLLGLRSFTRARDVDRDAALHGLREALADGQLTQAEFDARMAAALVATRIGDLTKLTEDLQPPTSGIVTRPGPGPRWQRVFGPAIIVLAVALLLAGIEGLTRIGGDNDGIAGAGSDGGIGFPALDFPGTPALHTADGLTTFISAVEEHFGSTETLRAVIYPDYVVIWMPQLADPTRVDTFYFDGSFDSASPAGTRDPEAEPLFDLGELDVEAMALLMLQAPAAVGIAEPTSIYAVIDRGYDAGGPVLSVYVSDAYVSGRLEAGLDGVVTDVTEAS